MLGVEDLFLDALQHQKPGKAPGLDSLCSEIKNHATAQSLEVLAAWLPFFLLAPTQNSKNLEKIVGIVAIPKLMKLAENSQSYLPIFVACPIQNHRRAYPHPHKSNNRFIASSGKSWILSREINCRSRHFPNSGYRA